MSVQMEIRCAKCDKWTDMKYAMWSPNVPGIVCPTCGELERVESIAPVTDPLPAPKSR